MIAVRCSAGRALFFIPSTSIRYITGNPSSNEVKHTHSSDVRALTVMENCIISGSRDRSVKLWTETDDGYQDAVTMISHSHFVSSVYAFPPSEAYPQGLIFSGGHDNNIFCYVPYSTKPERTFVGHTGAVCCLTGARGTLISSSWDGTAKIWEVSSGACSATLFGHTQAVWCVLHVPDVIVTGSADKLIKVFSMDGIFIRTLEGHTDCVRGLEDVGDGRILSCSNDGSVRKWALHTGECLQVVQSRNSFIYCVAASDSVMVCGGEESTVTVWFKHSETQVIELPAISVWAVAILPNSDIVTASNDGYLRIFTRDHSRTASKEEIQEYQRELRRSKEMQSTDAELQKKEALQKEGKFDGEIKLVRENEVDFCYSWSESSRRWELVGERVENPPEVNYYPLEKFVLFRNYDTTSILKKLDEFLIQMSIPEEKAKAILSDMKYLVNGKVRDGLERAVDTLTDTMRDWPEALVFPVLDLARVASLNPLTLPIIANKFSQLLSSFSRFTNAEASPINKMLTYKTLSNILSGEEGVRKVYEQGEIILRKIPDSLKDPSNHKGLEVAASTFLMNISAIAYNKKDLIVADMCLEVIKLSLCRISDPEAVFRVLVALGTIRKMEGTTIQTEQILSTLKTISKTNDKTGKCAISILKDLGI